MKQNWVEILEERIGCEINPAVQNIVINLNLNQPEIYFSVCTHYTHRNLFEILLN